MTPNPELKKQVKEILLIVTILGAVQLAVFFILSLLKIVPLGTALAGTVYGCAIAALNFILLARSVAKAVEKDPKNAQASVSMGYMLRLAVIAAAVFAAIKLPSVFNLWAAVIPLLFPRIAIMLINLKSQKQGGDNS